MIYRFHPDGSGEVIAERARPGIEPFLGLRYPAEDIPQQARALLVGRAGWSAFLRLSNPFWGASTIFTGKA